MMEIPRRHCLCPPLPLHLRGRFTVEEEMRGGGCWDSRGCRPLFYWAGCSLRPRVHGGCLPRAGSHARHGRARCCAACSLARARRSRAPPRTVSSSRACVPSLQPSVPRLAMVLMPHKQHVIPLLAVIQCSSSLRVSFLVVSRAPVVPVAAGRVRVQVVAQRRISRRKKKRKKKERKERNPFWNIGG